MVLETLAACSKKARHDETIASTVILFLNNINILLADGQLHCLCIIHKLSQVTTKTNSMITFLVDGAPCIQIAMGEQALIRC